MVKRLNKTFIIGDGSQGEELHDYLKDMSRYGVLSHEENLRLAEIIQSETGRKKEKAVKDLVCGNLRLVFAIASRYNAVKETLDFADLIQLGNIGLIKAAEKYDPSRGYKFSVMATWWIRQGITRGIANTANQIRVPVNKQTFTNKLKKKLSQVKGENKSKEELIEELGVTEKEYEEAIFIIDKLRNLKSLADVVPSEKGGEAMQMIEALPSEQDIDGDCLARLRNKTINSVFKNNLFTEEQKNLLIEKLLSPKTSFKKLASQYNYKEKDIKSFFEFYIQTFKSQLQFLKEDLI